MMMMMVMIIVVMMMMMMFNCFPLSLSFSTAACRDGRYDLCYDDDDDYDDVDDDDDDDDFKLSVGRGGELMIR